MSSVSNSAISGSLPIGCCLIARHPIQVISAFRLIHVQPDLSGQMMAWLVNLGDEKMPRSHACSDLIAAIAAGSLEVWHWTPGIPDTLRKSLSLQASDQAQSAWHRIKPLTGSRNLPAILNQDQRGKLLALRASALGCGRTQLYRDWSRYLRCGMTSDALTPRIATWCPPPWLR